MLLSVEEVAQYRADGFLVVPCPWPADLTRAALAAYERKIGLPATAPATARAAKSQGVPRGSHAPTSGRPRTPSRTPWTLFR